MPTPGGIRDAADLAERRLAGVALKHPHTYTRSFFARNPHVDPAQRVRLIDDPEWFVRVHLAEAPTAPGGGLPRPLPD
ncbi:hypothetical protein ACH4U7_33745 [Streptomyces sp. NPDC020845]|uniref:hypothetical protein n=1 Tax=Streptomyces sp. NPDC020845 TaxID=3365096 RepID=UPI00378A73FD